MSESWVRNTQLAKDGKRKCKEVLRENNAQNEKYRVGIGINKLIRGGGPKTFDIWHQNH